MNILHYPKSHAMAGNGSIRRGDEEKEAQDLSPEINLQRCNKWFITSKWSITAVAD